MRQENIFENVRSWRMGNKVCAFSDSERHLGHILKCDSQWLAFDATRLGESGEGFWIIGIFPDIGSARSAVELSSMLTNNLTRGAGAAM
jgi:hypothetical protein